MLHSESTIRKTRRISSSGRRRSVTNKPAIGGANRTGHAVNAVVDLQGSSFHQGGAYNEGPAQNPTADATACYAIARSRITGNISSSKQDRSFEGDFRGRKPKLFKGPAREATHPEQLLTHSCSDCQRFASLLMNQNMSKSIINSIIRHKSYCEPSSTPPNIWEPWSQG